MGGNSLHDRKVILICNRHDSYLDIDGHDLKEKYGYIYKELLHC